MIERRTLWTNGPLSVRLMDSLSSFDIKASECVVDSRSCSVCYTARAWGRSIDLELDGPEAPLMQTRDAGSALKSSIHRGAFSKETSEYIMFDFTRRYLRTMRVIMEGKQGILAFDLLSLRSPRMMEIFENAAEKVFGTARETLVIYIMRGNVYSTDSRGKAWDAYLEHRGITEKDWKLGL